MHQCNNAVNKNTKCQNLSGLEKWFNIKVSRKWIAQKLLKCQNCKRLLKQKMIFETEVFGYCSQLISKFETNGFATQLN